MTITATCDRVHTIVDSPIGALTLVAEDGALVGLHMDRQRHAPDPLTHGAADPAVFGELTAQLDAYFAGGLTEFDVPVRLHGTAFQRRVWERLRDIPYGETISYGELAARVGSPGAARAVGLANGRNPVAIVVPCHRVIGADGSLTGYGGGIDRKRWLLALETEGARPRLVG